MSANGPFTPSVFPYDPPTSNYVLGIVPTPGSVLDALLSINENLYRLVKKSGQERLYNVSPVTVFVPRKFHFNENVSPAESLNLLRSMTVMKILTPASLRYSPVYLLKTMATPYDMVIETNFSSITVNSVPVTESFECTNGVIHVLG